MKEIFILCTVLFLFSSCNKTASSILLNDKRTYEVSAVETHKNTIISVWMEGRKSRKPNKQISNTRLAYKFSSDEGNSWSKKKTIDNKKSFITGNPYLVTHQENTFLVFMNVKDSFFEGNLAFYQWDETRKEFLFKSFLAKTKNTLLDKPSISIKDNEIFVVYIEYSDTLDKGEIKYQKSYDNGNTWSIPSNLVDDNIIYLGVSSKVVNNRYYISYGSYWENKVFFTTIKNLTNSIQIDSNYIAQTSLEQPSIITELAVSKNEDVAIGWVDVHKENEVNVIVRLKGNQNWSKPLLLSKSGNLLSITFDNENNLLALYSEFIDNSYSVTLKKINLEKTLNLEEIVIIKESQIIEGERDYIGAFQKILSAEKANYLFWIDYAKKNKLYFTKIKK